MARSRLVLSPEERSLLEGVSALVHVNPFGPERVAAEKRILGSHHVAGPALWSLRTDHDATVNPRRIGERAKALAGELWTRLQRGARAAPEDQALYTDLCLYVAFDDVEDPLFAAVRAAEQGPTVRSTAFDDFARKVVHYLSLPGTPDPDEAYLGHLFALAFQVRRAFHHLFHQIIGTSRPAARLRAATWESIFTHDFRRYRRGGHLRLQQVSTLVTGPSGSGKELVARAIALSRYLPFDTQKRRFDAPFEELFHPVHLAAISPTLIESELFGHRKGAFTGALEDRIGRFEACPDTGCVFLDEVGEVDLGLQVKLLRVLQERSFERLGEVQRRTFEGKIIAATNRDLTEATQAGAFRDDLYYRLNADVIATPSLAARLADDRAELDILVGYLARRVAGDDEAAGLTDEVLEWIRTELPASYGWPGNVRELEQCVRNVYIRGAYHPLASRSEEPSGAAGLVDELAAGNLTADELVTRYCQLVHIQTGSYVETARRLGLDRRTVAKRVRGDADDG